MSNSFALKLIAGCTGFIWAGAAFSHISLETKTAPAGSSYKAVLQVGHGCGGSGTTALSVEIPPGFRGAKPMPKPGWTVTTQTADLGVPYESHGQSIRQDVARISWRAENKKAALPDAHFDQFTVRGNLHDSPGPMWFKVLQTCETGKNDWSQIPASGTSTKGLDYPAALLEVAAQAPGLSPAAMSVAAEPLQVQGAWVRTSVAGQGGTGAFMKLTARNAMRLVGVSSPVAAVAEVHEMKMEGDVMKMRAVPGLDLPAGQAVELKPGGYHLMLMQLRQPLTVGTMVPLTLILKEASGVERRQNLQLPVSAAAPGSGGKPDSGHGAHKH
jgi:periplasmic copper chaperone A